MATTSYTWNTLTAPATVNNVVTAGDQRLPGDRRQCGGHALYDGLGQPVA